MAADTAASGGIALPWGPSPPLPLELLRPVCGQLLEEVSPVLTHLQLTALDTLTLGDLLSLSGHTGDPHLVVVLAGLFAALNEGSVCLELTPNHLSRLGPPHQIAALTHHLDRFRDHLEAGVYKELVDDADGQACAPLIRVRGQRDPQYPDLLYFQRFFQHERRLKKRLEDLLDQGEAPLCTPDRIEALIGELWASERVIRLGAGRLPLAADPWQQAALRLILTRPFAVISGGPGTGKTSLMVNMLRLLSACSLTVGDIRLTAPTGRAAQRMREALQLYLPGIKAPTDGEKRLLGLEALTLHRLLRFEPRQQGFFYHADQPLPARVVIVDEVSMIDVGMLDRLLQAVDPRHTRLILLGDKDQLPSVQAGAVFSEMVPEADPSDPPTDSRPPTHRFHDHLVILKNNYRSGRRLLRLAKRINAGRMPELPPCTVAQAMGLPPDSYAAIGPYPEGGVSIDLETILTPWVDHHYVSAAHGGLTYLELAAALNGHPSLELTTDSPPEILFQLFGRLGQARILTIARRGPLGCVSLNRRVMADLTTRQALAIDPATGLFNGAPILLTRNDHVRQLFNGDVGVVLVDEKGNLRIYVQRGQSFVSAPLQVLGSWEPAFATTVHKSQGSEFTDLLLVFPGDPNHRLLCREIFYTGVTRARQRLLLLAHTQEMEMALSRRIQRSSGLRWSS